MEFTIDQALQKAIEAHKAGQVQEADRLYTAILKAQPKHPDANHNLGVLAVSVGKAQEALPFLKTALEANPSIAQFWFSYIDALIKLDNFVEAKALLAKAKSKGAKGDSLDRLDQQLQKAGQLPLEANQTAGELQHGSTNILDVKPDDADVYNNLGNALKEQGKLEEAIEAYKKALDIKPDDAEFHKSMGNALLALNKPDDAMQSYNAALSIKPNFAAAHNNIGAIFQTQGKLKEAIDKFNKALSFKPDHPPTIINAMSLSIQLFDCVFICEEFSERLENLKTDLSVFPKFLILQAIKAFILADKNLVIKYLKEYKRIDPKTLSKLGQNDQVFNTAYYVFLSKLIQPSNFPEQHSRSTDIIFHLGESHCLSYAHRTLTINGIAHRVVPKITFGGKVFHFNSENRNQYTAITQSNLESLPNGAKVFISFGEIDCRSNEGFIPAAEKLDQKLEKLIDQTIENYVKWFFDQNVSKRLQLYFINVPAPVYNKQQSEGLNFKVARTVALFNTAIEKYSLHHGFDTVDVFKFTSGKEGFSNGRFHVDTYHLGAKALEEIQRQLS